LFLSAKKSFLFTLPSLVFYGLFVVFPVFYGVYLSFTDIGSFIQKLNFIGFQNYLTIFAEGRFQNSFRITIIYVTITAVLINVIALFIAVLLDNTRSRYLNSVVRVFVYLPAILTPILIGFIWYYIYKLGIPALFSLVGLKSLSRIRFLSPSFALSSVIMTTCWLNIGVAMLIYIAGLLSVDPNMIDAGSIDGANSWQKLVRIKLPLITHAFIINFVNTLVFAFKQFDQIWSMTKGGPASTTETLPLYIYLVAFQNAQIGRASAAAYILFSIILVVSLVIIVSLNRRAVRA